MQIQIKSIETLPATILQILVSLAQIPVDSPGKGGIITASGLSSFLPAEFHEAFNKDMTLCITMTTQAQFDLSPKTVATNILPHYANFLAKQLTSGIMNYSKYGYPDAIKITVDADFFAVAEIQWLYSVVDVVFNPPVVSEDTASGLPR